MIILRILVGLSLILRIASEYFPWIHDMVHINPGREQLSLPVSFSLFENDPAHSWLGEMVTRIPIPAPSVWKSPKPKGPSLTFKTRFDSPNDPWIPPSNSPLKSTPSSSRHSLYYSKGQPSISCSTFGWTRYP